MVESQASVREWTDVLRRVRFGATVTVPGNTRGVRGSTVRAVALLLASYADPDGGRVFPGTARVAVAAEVDYRTAKRCLAVLRHLGLIALVRSAGRRRNADEYVLTIPVDLMERLPVLTPTQLEEAVESMRSTNRRSDESTGARRTRSGRVPDAPVEPVDNTAARVPDAPVDPPDPPESTGAGSTPTDESTGAGSTAVRVRVCPPTYQDLDTTPTHHSGDDLRTDAAGPRAAGAVDEDSSADDVGPGDRPLLRLIPGSLDDEQTTAPSSPAGFGFCKQCHAQGHITVAADPRNGSACAAHLRSAS